MLKQGQIFKNLKEICETFGWEYKDSTSSRKARLKELDSMCAYHKEGNKIIIDEVFSKQKPIEDKRKTINYMGDVETQLLKMLVEEDEGNNGVNIKTTYYLLRKFGLINESFKYGSNRLDKSATYLDIPIEVIEELFNTTKSSNTRTIESALKNLEKKKVLKWTKGYSITVHKELERDSNIIDIEYNTITEIDEFGDERVVPIRNVIINNNEVEVITREATDDEIRAIQHAEKQTFKHFGVKDMGELFRKRISMKEYYMVVNEFIKKEIPTFINYWRNYKIIYTLSDVKDYVKENHIRFSKKTFHNVNEGVQKNIKERAKNRQKKAEEREDNKYDYRLEDEFMEQVESFNETFISVDKESILKELKSTKPNYQHYQSKQEQFMKKCDELFGE